MHGGHFQPGGRFDGTSARVQMLLAAVSLFGVPHVPEARADVVYRLNSPDGRIQLSIEFPGPALREKPRWSATFGGLPRLTDCEVGLQTLDGGDLLAGVRVVCESRRSVDQRVPLLFGKSDEACDRFTETNLTL